MTVGNTIKLREEQYRVDRIGESGTGKFFGRQVVDLTKVSDGSQWFAVSRQGRIAWNARLTERAQHGSRA